MNVNFEVLKLKLQLFHIYLLIKTVNISLKCLKQKNLLSYV